MGSIRRVFDFLETWGLINFSGSALKQPLKWEEKDSKSGGASSQSGDARGGAVESIAKRRWCSGCKSLCSIACFACDKVIIGFLSIKEKKIRVFNPEYTFLLVN